MTASEYRLQIIHAKGGVAREPWHPNAPIETEMADDLCRRLSARGVGVFRTQRRVLKAVRECMAEMIMDLKRRV